MGISRPSYVYDARTVGRILGIPCECSDPVPKAADGDIVVYYGGWDLGVLEGTGKVVNDCAPHGKYWKTAAGYYRAIIRYAPKPNDLTFYKHAEAEISFLGRQYSGWQILCAPIGATVLAVHLGVTGEDLLQGNIWCCTKVVPYCSQVGICVYERRVHVFGGGDFSACDVDVFLGAVQRV